jgi:hypothetical protein
MDPFHHRGVLVYSQLERSKKSMTGPISQKNLNMFPEGQA